MSSKPILSHNFLFFSNFTVTSICRQLQEPPDKQPELIHRFGEPADKELGLSALPRSHPDGIRIDVNHRLYNASSQPTINQSILIKASTGTIPTLSSLQLRTLPPPTQRLADQPTLTALPLCPGHVAATVQLRFHEDRLLSAYIAAAPARHRCRRAPLNQHRPWTTSTQPTLRCPLFRLSTPSAVQTVQLDHCRSHRRLPSPSDARASRPRQRPVCPSTTSSPSESSSTSGTVQVVIHIRPVRPVVHIRLVRAVKKYVENSWLF